MPTSPTITKLAAPACFDLLRQAQIGRVLLSVDALPTARSVKFALLGTRIVMRVAAGSQVHRATPGRVVAFQSDHYDGANGDGWSIVALGVGEEVSDPEALPLLHDLLADVWSRPPAQDAFVQIPVRSIIGERVEWPRGE